MGISPLAALSTAAAGLAASRLAAGVKNAPSFFSLFAQPSEAPAPPAPGGKRAGAAQAAGQRIAELLSAAGIKTSLFFELQLDESGRVCVVSGHPQKERIEAALSRDTTLAAQLMELGGGAGASLRYDDGELTVG